MVITALSHFSLRPGYITSTCIKLWVVKAKVGIKLAGRKMGHLSTGCLQDVPKLSESSAGYRSLP
jgi:hypothetical protein